MFDTVCSLPLSAELFAQAVHPSEPIVAVGLATGHVQTFRLPSDTASLSAARNGTGHIETVWRTRRHKGSCRCLGFGVDGLSLFSAGTDGLVKVASAETGVVENKMAIPELKGCVDAPTVIHALSPQTLLLATDSAALHLYDLREPFSKVSARPQQTHRPHDDYISSLTPLPPSETSTSGFSKQWVTTGGTTLAVTDLRRGVLARSENQEEELVSSAYVDGLPSGGTSRGDKVVVGGASGVLTLWEKGAWDDQDERVYVHRDTAGGGESLETLAVVPDRLGRGKMVAVGLGNGCVSFVKLGPNKVVASLTHDDSEGVMGLGFDVDGRMVTGGGQVVKVWHEAMGYDEAAADDDDDDDDNGDSDGVDAAGSLGGERTLDSDSDAQDSSEDRDENKKNAQAGRTRRKRKRNRGKDLSGGRHVMAFQGLD